MGKCKWCSNFTQGEPTCSACKKKLMGDNSSKNCKMDAFKPNRLRPGIFHDVFSKNMETKLNSTCKQCGDDNDLMVAFTEHGICGKCVKKNHREAMR